MLYFLYDNSFDGFLTAIFDIYERRAHDVRIQPKARFQPQFFDTPFDVVTDPAKAERVWKGLQKRLSREACTNFYKCFLSELPEREDVMWQVARLAFVSDVPIEENLREDAVLKMAQIGKKLFNEQHRFEAFIRFEQLQDGLFYAAIAPDYDIIPLISRHFERRYADQRWLIYDTKRNYGIYYDLEQLEIVELEKLPSGGQEKLHEPQEALYQQLWKDYFQSVNIASRRNLKLHRRHVPVRYWKYLTEKR